MTAHSPRSPALLSTLVGEWDKMCSVLVLQDFTILSHWLASSTALLWIVFGFGASVGIDRIGQIDYSARLPNLLGVDPILMLTGKRKGCVPSAVQRQNV